MQDDVKKAVEWLRTLDVDDRDYGEAQTLLAHIDGEPERLAATVAREREEQREADARSCPTCEGDGFTMRVRECPFCSDSTHDHECPTDVVKVYCACGAAHIRATPLTATPLADELERAWNTTAKHVDERDAALARTKDLKTALHLEREAHGRALREALDPVVRAKMMEPPPPLLLAPDVAALVAERDALKARLADAEKLNEHYVSRIRELQEADVMTLLNEAVEVLRRVAGPQGMGFGSREGASLAERARTFLAKVKAKP